jgi:four helix bundle protein
MTLLEGFRCNTVPARADLGLMQDFKRLNVWRKAHELVLAVDAAFPPRSCRRTPWLRHQILRAAASISANIAEGCGKGSSREFLRFLDIAIASSRETENHWLLARDLKLISVADHEKLESMTIEVRRMLVGLSKALRSQRVKG